MPLEQIAIVFLAFALGGVLKWAIGAGAPFLAVPVMALLVDVPFAVAMFLMPNIISNALQGWQFRAHLAHPGFTVKYAAAGAFGAVFGTFALAWLDREILTTVVAVIVLSYVGFRAFKPEWSLAMQRAARIVLPVGAIGGVLQGSVGLSASVPVTFLNAIWLDRKGFIPTIS